MSVHGLFDFTAQSIEIDGVSLGHTRSRCTSLQKTPQMLSVLVLANQLAHILTADDFDAYIKHGKRLDQLKGKRLAELTRKTISTDDITKPLTYDDKAGGHVFAKVVSSKKLDDKDWRAIEKP